MRINKDDLVMIRTGEDKFLPKSKTKRTARVVAVDREAGKAIVEGVNVVNKHIKRSKRNPQGGRLAKEMPVPMANVQVVCPKCNKPARVGTSIGADGTKYRVCRKCKAMIDKIGPAKKQRLTKAPA